MSKLSGRDCEISAISTEKTSWLSIATPKATRIAFQASWPNLCNSKVEVLVVGAQAGIRAAKNATKTIPIVMVSSVDPVAAGMVDSLAHPGGNITGLARLTRDLSGKRLELLKEAVPGIKRVGVLRTTDDPA